MEWLSIIAIIVVALFIIFSLDDVVFDFYYIFRARKKIKGRLKIANLSKALPKPIAVFIPAWNEEDVIAPMLEYNLSSLNYPRAFYQVFVGVYPNDEATTNAVRPLVDRFRNLHLIINSKPGPTTKADNLNNLYSELENYEKDRGVRFAMVVIYDSEDVVHPTSLKLFNYLIPDHPAVQLPLLSLQPLPTLKNFFKNITSGTYVDEFTEHHGRMIVAREALGGFVPSAGTGFAVSRAALEKVKASRPSARIFDETNLTEDYELALEMLRLGDRFSFYLESESRIGSDGRIVREYIATREIPTFIFKQALKQKSRWIYGIGFQSLKLDKARGLSRAEKYSLFRDWKIKYSNLILLPGYLILAYVVFSSFFGGAALFPVGSFSWWLVLVLTGLAIERQVLRAMAIKHFYGWRSAIFACFFPPLFPIRYIWGNIINYFATLRAWRVRFFGSPTRRAKWEKTPHQYLPARALDRYRRKLGDLLLERGLVSTTTLGEILSGEHEGKTLGREMTEKRLITEDELLSVLGDLLKTGYIDIDKGLIDPALAGVFPKNLARKYRVFPVLHWSQGILLASAGELSGRAAEEIFHATGLQPKIVLSSGLNVDRAIRQLYSGNPRRGMSKMRVGEILLAKGYADEDTLIEALRIQHETGEKLGKILIDMNLVGEKQLAEVLLEQEGGPPDQASAA